jgi:ABC-type transporter Mla subunit MlaD
VRRGAIVAFVLAVLAAALALGASNDGAKGKHYEIVFDNAFGLAAGGDFKIAGVRAGETSSFEIVGRERPLALVNVKVTQPGFADLREDARCEIRPQSFIGEYFVDCQPGTSDKRLPDGGRVPVEQTSSTIPLDLVNNILRRPYTQRLRIIIGELGAGLAGRPEDLNEVLRRAHPGLRETSEVLQVLGRQTGTIKRFITDADRTIGALARRRRDVSRFVRTARETAEIGASRREDLALTFNRLPAFLAELEPYMGRLGELATAQIPLLRDLQAASGDLDTFLRRLQPFAVEGQPALEDLGDAAGVGVRAVRATNAEVEELRRLAADAPALAKPLRQFLQTIDDRKRAVEPDPRAAATDPPAPDKTHIRGQGGFTGMEAIWNYFYWQALSTNALDDVGHILRLNVLVGPCGSYFVTRRGDEDNFDQCNQWLGPFQPGINRPDPTRPGNAAVAADAQRVQAAPLPPVAPARGAAAGETGAPAPLLDYLLSP